MSQPVRNQVFISYSHLDGEWVDRLKKMLAPFARSNKLSLWVDTEIKPGRIWSEEIRRGLDSAKVAVLLVSPNFLHSEFVVRQELPPLLDAAKQEGVTILWVPLSASLVESTDIFQYQAASDPQCPLDICSPGEQNLILVAICKKIIEAVNAKTPAEKAAEEAKQKERANAEEFVRLQKVIREATAAEDWDAVIKASDAQIRINPSDKKALAMRSRAYHQQDLLKIYTKAKQQYENGELYLALTEFHKLRAQEENYKDVAALIAAIQGAVTEGEARLKEAARMAMTRREWETVAQSLEQLSKLVPTTEDIRTKLNEAKRNQENLERAYSAARASLPKDLNAALKHLYEVRRIGVSYKDVDALIAEVEHKVRVREAELKQQDQAAKEAAERLWAQADAAINEADWPKAIKHLWDLLQMNPTDTRVRGRLEFAQRQQELLDHYEKGVKLYKAGKYDRALDHFDKVCELQPDYKRVHSLIEKATRKRAWKKKIYILQYSACLIISAVAIPASLYIFYGWLVGDTAHPDWTVLMPVAAVSLLSLVYFWLLIRSATKDSALSGCLALIILIILPFSGLAGYFFAPLIRSWLAETYIESGAQVSAVDADQVIHGLTRAININPKDARAYQYRGKAFDVKGEHERALADLDRAIELIPTQDVYFITRGWIRHRAGNLHGAFDDFTEAIRLKPDKADWYFQRGYAYFQLKDYDRAVTDFDRATKANPTSGKAFNYLGQAYHAKGDNDAALSNLNKAVESNPDYIEAYFQRGKVYAAVKEFGNAVADFDRAIKLNKDYAAAYLERGKVYIHRSDSPDYNQAAIDLGKAVNYAPSNPEALYYRGWLHYQFKEYEQAITLLDQAIRLASDYQDAYDLRGSAHAAVRRYELALSDFGRSIELSKGLKASSFLKRGEAYENVRDRENAIADFRKVLEFRDPDLALEARKHLRRLTAHK